MLLEGALTPEGVTLADGGGRGVALPAGTKVGAAGSVADAGGGVKPGGGTNGGGGKGGRMPPGGGGNAPGGIMPGGGGNGIPGGTGKPGGGDAPGGILRRTVRQNTLKSIKKSLRRHHTRSGEWRQSKRRGKRRRRTCGNRQDARRGHNGRRNSGDRRRGICLRRGTVHRGGTLLCSRRRAFRGSHESLVSLELRSELVFRKGAVLDLGTLAWRLADGTGIQSKLDLFATLVVRDIRGGDTFHTEDFNFIAIAARKRIFDAGKTGRIVRVC
jgi:hypothetical protein